MDIFNTEIWRIGIVSAPIQEVAAAGSLEQFSVKWIEAEDAFCFLADPFGIWRDDKLYLFVEAYDYRTRCGYIVAYVLDANLNILESRPVLREDWHLSYPVVFEAQGEIWMLPEAYKSGRLTLYRASEFPWQWQPVPEFQFPEAAIDASPLFYAQRWWMFYTPPSPKAARTSTLKLASADHLFGPWDQHPIQTLREDKSGARMGGTPFLAEGKIVLPTQDCRETYGAAVQLLSFPTESLPYPELSSAHRLCAPQHNAPYLQGLHTLSQAGPVTLVDTKRIRHGSPGRLLIELSRLWRKPRD